ncbi:serine hydrolase domain-containing protein [Rhodovibrionaceae bacterium A322]
MVSSGNSSAQEDVGNNLTGQEFSATEIAEVNTPPKAENDGWPVSQLSTEGIDPAAIALLHKRIKAGEYVNLHSLLIARHGKLVSEAYFGSFTSQSSQQRKAYGRQTLHQTRSSFKSVTGLLAGIAVTEGIISLDDKLMPLLSDYQDTPTTDPRKEDITLGQLLNMTSGFDCAEMPGDRPQREKELRDPFNMVRSHAGQPMSDQPGRTWRYCSSNPMLFGFALQAALTRQNLGTVKHLLDSRMMTPLGIGSYKTGFSPQRLMYLHGGQKMRPRDLMKFGQLLVSEGRWRGYQVVPESWVEDLLSPGVPTDWSWTASLGSAPQFQRPSRYRYQWFQTRIPLAGEDLTVFHSWGNGGQFILAVPDLDLVVTSTAGNYGEERAEEQMQIFHLLYHAILPAIS